MRTITLTDAELERLQKVLNWHVREIERRREARHARTDETGLLHFPPMTEETKQRDLEDVQKLEVYKTLIPKIS